MLQSFTFTTIFLSISVLFILILSLALCTCWHKKHNSIVNHVYVLDEKDGLKKVSVRRLAKIKKKNPAVRLVTSTNFDVLKDETMSNDRLPKRVVEGKYSKFSDAWCDGYKIEMLCVSKEEEEMMSCHSADSRNTFFSTYPLVRSLSTTETFRSVDSDDSV